MTRREINKVLTACQSCSKENLDVQRLVKEMHCREMINSCLAYGINFLFSEYRRPYDSLGKERLQVLFSEQKKDFDEAKILYTKGYRTIIWKDEIPDFKESVGENLAVYER